MQVRKKLVWRGLSFLLALVLTVGAFGIDAFAGCPTVAATMHTGWYTLADASSTYTYGRKWNAANGHFADGIPTHTLFFKDSGVGTAKWHVAYCLDPARGAMASTNYGRYNTHYCVEPVVTDPVVRAALGAILYCGEYNNGVPIDSSGNIGVRGGNPATDHYIVLHTLVWATRHGKITIGQDSRVSIDQGVKADIDWIIQKMSTGHRPRDGQALRGWVDAFYKHLNYCFLVPSFSLYTETHPLGATMKGKPGSGSSDIVLEVSSTWDAQDEHGWYYRDFEDKNGVLNGFDFDMEKNSNLFDGAPGVYVKKVNGKIRVMFDPDFCEKDFVYESNEVVRNLPFGQNSVLWFDCLNPNEQRFAVYQPGSSKLGARIKVKFTDSTEERTSAPIVTSPIGTVGIPTGTPSITTPPETPQVYVRKESDDGNVAGIVFTITGNGQTYHKKTNESGFIDVSDLPQYFPGTQQLIEYHIEEEIPVEYIHDKDNASKNFVLEPGKPVTLRFENKCKVWRLTFKKHDSVLATQAQGKGTLAGAIFGVYKDGDLLDMYTTDENGVITTDYYPCGPGYTLTEITPPSGYMSDPTVYSIGLMPGETLEQYNDCNRMEPLDGDDPDVIRRAYSIKSAMDYKASSEMYESQN